MENKKCENCKHWAVTTPPAIGTCKKDGKTTIFNHSCSQYETNETNDMFNHIFGGSPNVSDIFNEYLRHK